MTDPIRVLRTSHEKFATTVAGLDAEQVSGPSYASDWSIADTASHLGSQAEIFGAFLDAGLAGDEPPGGDSFPPIWERWNAMAPADQVSASVQANEAFVSRVEALTEQERAGFSISLFGQDLDLAGMARVRLSEHALHTWDIAVALEDASVVPADAVEVLAPGLHPVLGRAMRAVEGAGSIEVVTRDPETGYVVDLEAAAPSDDPGGSRITMPAEAFVRLVYGRLDADHTPSGIDDPDGVLDTLRQAFPGF